MAKTDELHRLINDALADDPHTALIACRRAAARSVPTTIRSVWPAALRLAQEFAAFADDGSDVTPW